METQQVNINEHKKAVIYTDSKITLRSIRSAKNRSHLVEEIRGRAVTPNKKNWKIEFKWVESSRRNLWNRNSRSTNEGGNSKLLCNIQQDTKMRFKKGHPGRKHKKMAKSKGKKQ